MGVWPGRLLATDSQTFSALRPAALQDDSPVLGAHSNAKAVRAAAAAFVWLERALALHRVLRSRSAPRLAVLEAPRLLSRSWLSLDEPAMLAKRFQVCQSLRFVLESAPFSFEFQIPETHARLVSSQSFPHLWKKLWKCRRI